MNGFQNLTKDDERYIYCQLKDFSYTYDHMSRRATWKAKFIAHNPFWYAVDPTTSALAPSTGVGFTLANGGNAPTRVKMELTARAETDDDCQVENTTKGEIFKYRGLIAAAAVLEVDNRHDSDDFEVKNASSSDFANFEGDFLTLDAGNNTVEYTGVDTPSTVFTWRDCWF